MLSAAKNMGMPSEDGNDGKAREMSEMAQSIATGREMVEECEDLRLRLTERHQRHGRASVSLAFPLSSRHTCHR